MKEGREKVDSHLPELVISLFVHLLHHVQGFPDELLRYHFNLACAAGACAAGVFHGKHLVGDHQRSTYKRIKILIVAIT